MKEYMAGGMRIWGTGQQKAWGGGRRVPAPHAQHATQHPPSTLSALSQHPRSTHPAPGARAAYVRAHVILGRHQLQPLQPAQLVHPGVETCVAAEQIEGVCQEAQDGTPVLRDFVSGRGRRHRHPAPQQTQFTPCHTCPSDFPTHPPTHAPTGHENAVPQAQADQVGEARTQRVQFAGAPARKHRQRRTGPPRPAPQAAVLSTRPRRQRVSRPMRRLHGGGGVKSWRHGGRRGDEEVGR